MTRTADTSDGFPRLHQHPGQLTTNRTAPAHRGPSHRPRHADTGWEPVESVPIEPGRIRRSWAETPEATTRAGRTARRPMRTSRRTASTKPHPRTAPARAPSSPSAAPRSTRLERHSARRMEIDRPDG